MKTLLPLLLWCICAAGSLAQDVSGLALAAIRQNRQLFPLCARTNFSATVRFEMLAPAGQHRLTLPFRYSTADGLVRQEILIGEMTDFPQESRLHAKQLGFDTMTVVVRPDESKVYVLMDWLRAYCELPVPEAAMKDALGKEYKFQETVTGTEVVGGYECTKAKFIEVAHPKDVATIWRSKALGGFPLKVEMISPDLSGMSFHFTQVDLRKPSPDSFSIPTNYVKLPDSKSFIPYALEQLKRQNIPSSKP
ncbi:MAG TPA: DUF4412 domain-containing protein [Candidatus Limnocylindria bacterium]|nr:DUF4412 domain-containing protein [Candidatus Limnocylindria bacterium]